MKTLSNYLKELRRGLGITQESIGTSGIISTPAYIKLENGQRSPSENMIRQFVNWLVHQKYHTRKGGDQIVRDLLFLKYAGDKSAFLREQIAVAAKVAGMDHLFESATIKKVNFRKRTPRATRHALAA